MQDNLNLCIFNAHKDTFSTDISSSVFHPQYMPGPSRSKLTMSLVNDSLKFTSSDTQIC